MIGQLPTAVEIDGCSYKIRTDYRDILTIFEAFSDTELTEQEKWMVALEIFYEKIPVNIEEAIKQLLGFLNRGEEEKKEANASKKLYDWEQDEQLIFQAVNKVAKTEVRAIEYMHWWTFMGYFSEIGESLFSSVVSIRDKQNKRKPLEKHEREFYKKNKQVVDLKRKYSNEQQAEMDRLNNLIGV
ncbi:MAG: hypothetical protein E7290_12540 [Lachnospiraceae bacterium]|nr:hypothetical protein [Lachnospiraceae bacterium]